MKKKLLMMLVAATMACGAQSADAALELGPPRADLFPLWLQDSSGLKLQLCLETRNAANPEAGPCFFEKTRKGTILEAAYWSAEGFIVHPDFDRILLVLAVEAERIPAAPGEPGGPAILNVMRLRLDPVKEKPLPVGDYTIETPFGSFILPVTEGVPKQEPTRVDVLVGRDPATGNLVVGQEHIIMLPPAAGQTVLDGAITNFPKAAVAPPGFVGDGAAIAEPGAPAPRVVNPGPDPVGEQVLVGAPGGSTFRITYPDGVTVVGAAPDQAKFLVTGSIFETPNAANVTAEFSKLGKRERVLTITSQSDGKATASAFGPQLPAPAVDTNGDQLTELDVVALTPADTTFAGVKPKFPQRIVVAPTDGSAQVVSRVKDVITGTANFRFSKKRGKGTLTITTDSSFDILPAKEKPTLTAVIDGVTPVKLNAAGNVSVKNLTVAPQTVTITSTAGGEQTFSVLNTTVP